MKKTILFALVALNFSNLSAQAEQFWINPAKGEAPRCVDGEFGNQPYTDGEGPSQHFVFTSADGEKHSLFFETHEECLTKLHLVQKAWISGSHQLVKITGEGSESTFGVQTPEKADYAREIDHLNEKVWALQKAVDSLENHTRSNRVISSEPKH